MSNPIEKYLNESGQTTILIKKTQVELIKYLINEKINDCDINIQNMRRQKKIKEEKHRKIEGKIKRIHIKRHGFNKWFITFICEVNDFKNIENINQKSIGVDMGLNHFITQSNGQKKENPRFYRKEEKALTKASRNFSNTEKGSFERIKKIKVLKRVHERIANKRKDFCHKASNTLVKKYGIICIEDLNSNTMISNDSRMNKSIYDASWKMFFRFLEHKAGEAGVQVIKVNPRNTSKMCSRCGVIKDYLELKNRIYYCLWCGLEIDRDENASNNILRLGLQSVNKESPYSTELGVIT